MSLRTRLITVVGLVLLSAYALFPRNVTVRERQADGVFRDRTERRVPLKYGLDLSGGMHLALEVDESRGAIADKSEAIDRALKVVRTRIDQFGVAEPVVQKVGNERIIVELPGIDDRERAERLVRESAFLQFQITDDTRALDRVMPRLDQVIRAKGLAQEAGRPAADTTRSRALTELFATADDTAKGADSAAVADSAASDTGLFAGAADGPFSSLIQPGGIPGEYVVSKDDVDAMRRYLDSPDVQAALPPGKVVRWGVEESAEAAADLPYRRLYVLDARPIITGEYLIDARPATDPVEGNLVTFELNNVGGRRFRTETQRHINDYMAIVLDDVVQGQPPIIRGAISTRGQITMTGKPLQAAQDLALVLRAGALPVPLKVVEARTIGSTLGEDSIEAGKRAGLLGIVFVVAFMIIYYRFSGVLAVGGLTTYVVFTLAILAGFDAVLTLPGLAGFVLSIGMAVDANVLIFERIREELDKGHTVRAAVDGGFKHALSAIIDSNVTTALTAAILYQFGTGPVRGFAVTLIAGLAASMVSAIFVVRTLYLLWLSRARNPQTLSI